MNKKQLNRLFNEIYNRRNSDTMIVPDKFSENELFHVGVNNFPDLLNKFLLSALENPDNLELSIKALKIAVQHYADYQNEHKFTFETDDDVDMTVEIIEGVCLCYGENEEKCLSRESYETTKKILTDNAIEFEEKVFTLKK